MNGYDDVSGFLPSYAQLQGEEPDEERLRRFRMRDLFGPLARFATPPFFPGSRLPAPLGRLEENPHGLLLEPRQGREPGRFGALSAEPDAAGRSARPGVLSEHGQIAPYHPRYTMERRYDEDLGLGRFNDDPAVRNPRGRLGPGGLGLRSTGLEDTAALGQTSTALANTPALGETAPTLGVRPQNPLEEYRAVLGQEPTREGFKVVPLKTWQKILGPAAAFAAGWNDPARAGQVATDIFGAPERQAEEEYGRAHKKWEGKLGRLGEQVKLGQVAALTDEARARTGQILARPDKPEDKRLDSYVSDQGRHVEIFQRPDGSVYEKPLGAVREKDPTDRQETPFAVWRKQHPQADVSEYFRLQPEARRDVRDERGDRETPAQRLARQRQMNQAETQKNATLARAENEIRRRYGLTGFAATEAWPQQAIEELDEAKQRIQDEYETKLGNLGADVTHFEYGQRGQLAAAPAAPAAGQAAVLDRNNPEHRDIAAQILAEAGGDKQKARQIARKRGYKF